MLKTALRLAAISFVVFPVSVSAQPVQFSTHRDYPSGYGPASIATGDVNGDGIRDLAVANRLDDSVAVLLGNADGSFQRPVSVYLGPNSSPCSVGIGDFNRDGRLDLAVANSGANTVSILPGNGDGTFQPALSLAAGTGPASLAVADFNGDGKSDLAVANTGSNDLSIILGNGDGTFQPAQRWVTDAGPSFVAVADFNRDTKPDLAVVNSGSGTISVLLGNGDGTFQAPSTFGAGGTHVGSIAVGDFNGDGAQDLAVTNTDANTVSVLAGNGDGTFQPLRDFDAGSGPTAVVTGDFDGDGREDLAIANGGSAGMDGASTVSVLAGAGDGTFGAPRAFAVGSVSSALAAGNFNGDAISDLAVANSYSTTVSVLLGTSVGSFPAALTLDVGLNPEGLTTADFNGDGHPDLAVSNAGSDSVSVMLGNGDGTFQPPLTFPAGAAPVFVTTADVNRDGKPDLICANYGAHDYYSATVASTVSVLLGNGDGTFGLPRTFQAGPGPHGIAVGDFNRDGIPDLAVADLGPYPNRATTVAVLIGAGDGTFGAPRFFDAGHALTGVAVGDFNRDGVDDLALSSGGDATVSVLLGNGNGTFAPKASFGAGSSPKSVAVGDFNGDQIPDLAVADHWSDTVSVLLGNGDGTFQPRRTFETGRNPAWISVADLDGDGVQDLAIANWFATTVSVLLGNGDGTFRYGVQFGAGAAPEKVVVADFNEDGQPDLAVANYFGRSVSVLIDTTYTARVATPSFSPAGGTYVGGLTVTIGVTTQGAVIHFTIDGSAPTLASPVYAGPLPIGKTTIVRAAAFASGMTASEVAQAAYVIKAFAPTFTPSSGTYVESVTVTLASATGGATIRYTTDGSAPSASSPAYTAPIALARNTTVRAIAVASGMAASDEAVAAYHVRVASPAFSAPGGTYDQPQTISIRTTTAGATIYFTTDGSAPTTSSTVYTSPISIPRTMTVRAIAVAGGMDDSAVSGATYTLQAATPTFNPPAGNYLLPQFVAIASASPGVTIYYTTDGSTPTTSSTRYTGPILVVMTTTIRAIAVAPGWSPSAVAAARYTFLVQ